MNVHSTWMLYVVLYIRTCKQYLFIFCTHIELALAPETLNPHLFVHRRYSIFFFLFLLLPPISAAASQQEFFSAP